METRSTRTVALTRGKRSEPCSACPPKALGNGPCAAASPLSCAVDRRPEPTSDRNLVSVFDRLVRPHLGTYGQPEVAPPTRWTVERSAWDLFSSRPSQITHLVRPTAAGQRGRPSNLLKTVPPLISPKVLSDAPATLGAYAGPPTDA